MLCAGVSGPHSPRSTLVCVHSKFAARDKNEVDHFVHSIFPYNKIMGDLNDNIWAATPRCYLS